MKLQVTGWYPEIFFWIAASLFAVADTQATTGNPNRYQAIPERNSFGLVPPSRPRMVDPPPQALPEIFVQGTTSILGIRRVLFKVRTPAAPGQQAMEKSYILGEGERQDEVEVLVIDETTGTVRFNNHGTIQTLSLHYDNAKAEPRRSARSAPEPLGQPGLAQTHVAHVMDAVYRRQVPASPQRKNQLSHEEQTIMIEVERERTKDQVRNGELPPLPQTELSPSDSRTSSTVPAIPQPD